MTRDLALLEAALTVQRWRRLPPYTRARVLGHVARALACRPFLVGGRKRDCGAADGGEMTAHRTLHARRNCAYAGASEIAKPACGAGGLSIPAMPERIVPSRPILSDPAAFCKRQLATGEVCPAPGLRRRGCSATMRPRHD
jgi:hypothetical protein